jgi:hypothetical protein
MPEEINNQESGRAQRCCALCRTPGHTIRTCLKRGDFSKPKRRALIKLLMETRHKHDVEKFKFGVELITIDQIDQEDIEDTEEVEETTEPETEDDVLLV